MRDTQEDAWATTVDANLPRQQGMANDKSDVEEQEETSVRPQLEDVPRTVVLNIQARRCERTDRIVLPLLP